ncbi:type I restriction enzyme HsdR N-terminal domain-containing protein [Capnocytophaga catalasegens]|uniref:Restriction endonuclease subunit R n=1 Tax=Capnocytophaga catalasegens TaxID=1004260 RepID=A0AAV5ATV7_9FLAO|nr:type I restriction enzyme HsdR N-terminal domain-containing protein [Capnocytophaga catalasegens]GIZ14616.1 restriction endonuclease subunit R [Capnocytophaga catalasegens]GJM50818.1 restriction endonuclease subunit R [Capnocytophaga catalasegens]GJM51971.1 restriction endonuclease subunit R [Capnocytophaga catalasegens]
MQRLNFPDYQFRFKSSENKPYIFDIIRKKFVVLQPEEWVRQHVIHFLIAHNYPISLISIEKKLTLNGLTKRYDIVVYLPDGRLFLLVECKAPEVEITQEVFDQIARYNLTLKANNLMVTNGLQHFFCQIDYTNQHFLFLKQVPFFPKTSS